MSLVEHVITRSSTISKITEDRLREAVIVEFKAGGIKYEFYGIPDEVVKEMISAESVGSYFQKHIRNGGYEFTKLGA